MATNVWQVQKKMSGNQKGPQKLFLQLQKGLGRTRKAKKSPGPSFLLHSCLSRGDLLNFFYLSLLWFVFVVVYSSIPNVSVTSGGGKAQRTQKHLFDEMMFGWMVETSANEEAERKQIRSVVTNSLRPHGLQSDRLLWGFPRQECWSGLPFPSPRDLPDPGIEPWSRALQADSLPGEPPGSLTHVFSLYVL